MGDVAPPDKPVIILMAGLPGTGKSTLAKGLSALVCGAILNKDTIRHAIFAQQDVEYSSEQDDFCMEVMLQAAEYILRKNPKRHVFLDGRTFSRSYQIDRVIAFADRLHQPWRILECTCSDTTAKARLEQPSNHPARNRDFDLYKEVQGRFEPVTLTKTVLDTDMSIEECIASALCRLKT